MDLVGQHEFVERHTVHLQPPRKVDSRPETRIAIFIAVDQQLRR